MRILIVREKDFEPKTREHYDKNPYWLRPWETKRAYYKRVAEYNRSKNG